jgi:hypothetical protein
LAEKFHGRTAVIPAETLLLRKAVTVGSFSRLLRNWLAEA